MSACGPGRVKITREAAPGAATAHFAPAEIQFGGINLLATPDAPNSSL